MSSNAGMGFPALIENHRDDIVALCRRHHARRLELFGSAARGDFDAQRSDLDFLVELEEGLPPGALAQAFFDLKDGLEALFGRSVDLVMARSIRNPHFLRRVNAERQVVYAD